MNFSTRVHQAAWASAGRKKASISSSQAGRDLGGYFEPFSDV
jgi:hypothetical protein